ncbi:MAG: methylmalonyl-CoA mutase [Chloroflexi bacterium]|nr:MAG: methylmalonyl-CoA mutase [Chloroflexota bacterium]RLC97388.1 MAG: methylmalonyl-CoA mutase [Chloroflexota bacterium]
MDKNKVKILMAKPGLEGHWRGIIAVSSAFRDAGFEVIYGGHMLPAEIAATAVQEDVDIVGLSILSSNYMRLVSETVKELKDRGRGDVMILLGGIIYKEDFPALKEMGVAEIFLPGTPLDEIVEFVRRNTSEASQKVS